MIAIRSWNSRSSRAKRSTISWFSRRGVASIKRRINGMGFDRGRKFRITGYEKLYAEIAERYNLTDGQVMRIVGR